MDLFLNMNLQPPHSDITPIHNADNPRSPFVLTTYLVSVRRQYVVDWKAHCKLIALKISTIHRFPFLDQIPKRFGAWHKEINIWILLLCGGVVSSGRVYCQVKWRVAGG